MSAALIEAWLRVVYPRATQKIGGEPLPSSKDHEGANGVSLLIPAHHIDQLGLTIPQIGDRIVTRLRKLGVIPTHWSVAWNDRRRALRVQVWREEKG